MNEKIEMLLSTYAGDDTDLCYYILDILNQSENPGSSLEYFMEKDPVPGSAVPVHTLHGLYDHALAQAPQELTELFQLSKKEFPLSERWFLTYNG